MADNGTTELYKKYRPKRFDKVIGNAETVASLKNMLSKGTLPHTILFNGPSGCGKTTLARILVRELQCHDLDFKEINSASFRGIDTVRDIQRLMSLAPAGGPVRVWLMDEVHKLSNDAQNAALKMLEDTPPHVYFFLCTTDPAKLIKPILTRCCEMPVRLLNTKESAELLTRVAERESVELSESDRDALIDASQGSARTLLVLLDKIANLPPEQREEAIRSKLSEQAEGIDLCRALMQKAPWKKVATILQNLTADPEEVRWNVLGYARVVLLKEGKWEAYNIIKAFERPFYDSKAPGLAAACYDALFSKE